MCALADTVHTEPCHAVTAGLLPQSRWPFNELIIHDLIGTKLLLCHVQYISHVSYLVIFDNALCLSAICLITWLLAVTGIAALWLPGTAGAPRTCVTRVMRTLHGRRKCQPSPVAAHHGKSHITQHHAFLQQKQWPLTCLGCQLICRHH